MVLMAILTPAAPSPHRSSARWNGWKRCAGAGQPKDPGWHRPVVRPVVFSILKFTNVYFSKFRGDLSAISSSVTARTWWAKWTELSQLLIARRKWEIIGVNLSLHSSEKIRTRKFNGIFERYLEAGLYYFYKIHKWVRIQGNIIASFVRVLIGFWTKGDTVDCWLRIIYSFLYCNFCHIWIFFDSNWLQVWLELGFEYTNANIT